MSGTVLDADSALVRTVLAAYVAALAHGIAADGPDPTPGQHTVTARGPGIRVALATTSRNEVTAR